MRQIATTLSRREEWKLSSQLVANPKGQYLVAEKKDEQVGPPKDPTLSLKRPYELKAPFPECLKESNQFGKKGENIQGMLKVFK
jgi:hypothetical protein